tara:strand:- start:155 stop:529 length:375 start_codon:yes stop_codon:yes gene_type:complete
MNILLLSILEALYVIYMLNYFKTRYSLAHPLSNYDNNYLKHPVGMSEKPISNICEFGHQVSWLLGLYIIIRGILLPRYKKVMRLLSIIVLIITATVSLLNLNATVYLIPYFIFEIILIKNNFSV